MQQFFTENSLYVVLAIILIIWLGIAIFLINIDKRLKKIEDSEYIANYKKSSK